ncbi:MAG: GNAT family N-acetyltransferase [Planctomycetota bacterium]
MAFGWEGEKVRLVPLERTRHFENCIRWLNDPQVTAWLLIGDFPLTRLQEEEFFDSVSRPGEAQTNLALAIETLEEEHLGVCGLHNISFRHGVATSGTFLGRPQLWNRGYGTDAVALRTRYAFEVLGLRLLLTEVMAENVGSARVLLKNGYEECGRIPGRYWKRGAYRDCIQLVLTRERWLQRVRPD